MRHIDTDTLATFVAIVETGSFTQAGQRVGRSQAAVSTTISKLEKRLSIRLLNRTGRTVTLTPDGHTLCNYARRLLALESEMFETLIGAEGSGHVRLGMPDDYLGLFGVSVMEHFAARHPSISVEVVCEFSDDLEKLVEAGRIDLAIVTRRDGDYSGDVLRREALTWVGPVNAHPERAEELPLALFPDNCRARPHILKALSAAGRAYRITWVSSHMQSIQSAVMMGFGLTALPASALSFDHRKLGPAEGFPPLPELELALKLAPGIDLAGRKMARFLRTEFSVD